MDCKYDHSIFRELEVINTKLHAAIQALELIAAPMRADGTYNRDRAACEKLAKDTLDVIKQFDKY